MGGPQPMSPNTTVAVQATAGNPSPTAETVNVRPILAIPLDLPGPAYESICTEIVREQAGIIGQRLTLEQLQPIRELTVDPQTLRCSINGSSAKVVNDVVNSFSQFFGSAAVEVCREAADRYLMKLPATSSPNG